MGFWNEIKNVWEKVNLRGEGFTGDIVPHQGEAEKREAARLANEQIRNYREQTDATRLATAEAKRQHDVERRRVEEKTIRGIRNKSRSGGGFLNVGAPASSVLGNSTGLPTKMGNV